MLKVFSAFLIMKLYKRYKEGQQLYKGLNSHFVLPYREKNYVYWFYLIENNSNNNYTIICCWWLADILELSTGDLIA